MCIHLTLSHRLEDDEHTKFLLLPTANTNRMIVTPLPFATEQRLDYFNDREWIKLFQEREMAYFVYELHTSEEYLKAESVVSALNLAHSLVAVRQYHLIPPLLPLLFKDTPYDKIENWLLGKIIEKCASSCNELVRAENTHPDAVGLLLRLYILAKRSGMLRVPHGVNARENFMKYMTCVQYVHAGCRLTMAEEREIAATLGDNTRLGFLDLLETSDSETLGVLSAELPPVQPPTDRFWLTMAHNQRDLVRYFPLLQGNGVSNKPMGSAYDAFIGHALEFARDELALYDAVPPPSAPDKPFACAPPTGSTIDLEWEPPSSPADGRHDGRVIAVVEGYHIEMMCVNGSNDWNTVMKNTWTNEPRWRVTNDLEPSQMYQFRISAITRVGLSPASFPSATLYTAAADVAPPSSADKSAHAIRSTPEVPERNRRVGTSPYDHPESSGVYKLEDEARRSRLYGDEAVLKLVDNIDPANRGFHDPEYLAYNWGILTGQRALHILATPDQIHTPDLPKFERPDDNQVPIPATIDDPLPQFDANRRSKISNAMGSFAFEEIDEEEEFGLFPVLEDAPPSTLTALKLQLGFHFMEHGGLGTMVPEIPHKMECKAIYAALMILCDAAYQPEALAKLRDGMPPFPTARLKEELFSQNGIRIGQGQTLTWFRDCFRWAARVLDEAAPKPTSPLPDVVEVVRAGGSLAQPEPPIKIALPTRGVLPRPPTISNMHGGLRSFRPRMFDDSWIVNDAQKPLFALCCRRDSGSNPLRSLLSDDDTTVGYTVDETEDAKDAEPFSFSVVRRHCETADGDVPQRVKDQEFEVNSAAKSSNTETFTRGVSPSSMSTETPPDLSPIVSRLEAVRNVTLVAMRTAFDTVDQIANEARTTREELITVAQQRPHLCFSFIASTLLVSDPCADLVKLNPRLSDAAVVAELHEHTVAALFWAIRLRQINVCLEKAIDLESRVKQWPLNGSTRATVLQKSTDLAAMIEQKRHWTDTTIAGEITFDPKFLIFEFTSPFGLRERQYILSKELAEFASSGKSTCRQMIMGSGKTTVIGPMVALLLADGTGLVVQVVPDQLLDMSTSVMRNAFGTVAVKNVVTLAFSRNGPTDNWLGVSTLLQKLRRVRTEAGIVCSTPNSVKSLMLKFLDTLAIEESLTPLLLVPRKYLGKMTRNQRDRVSIISRQMVKMTSEADMARSLLQLLRGEGDGKGKCMIDEVDMVLHTLKSELNFPVGAKEPLDLSPERWALPMHLFDGVYFACGRDPLNDASFNEAALNNLLKRNSSTNQMADQRGRADRDEHLTWLSSQPLAEIIKYGLDEQAMIKTPHLMILDKTFYRKTMRWPMARWAAKWLMAQRDVISCHDAARASALRDDFSAAFELAIVEYISGGLSDPRAASLSQPLAIQPLVRDHHRVRQLLNLAKTWVVSLLAHSLSKRSRVEFGLLSDQDQDRLALIKLEQEQRQTGQEEDDDEDDDEREIENQRQKDARMSAANLRSRDLLAVPFVGKDVPSQGSEFSSPEVAIGMTINAFRIEGMREVDLNVLVTRQLDAYSKESGPPEQRRAYQKFEEWRLLGEERRKLVLGSSAPKVELLTLEMIQPKEKPHMQAMMELLSPVPAVASFYLDAFVFRHTQSNAREGGGYAVKKLSASGADIGSDCLFGVRLGFSGTPSDLIPRAMRPCAPEPGSDGKVISKLTDPALVTDVRLMSVDWDVDTLLTELATEEFLVLIDTGAIITGYTNEGVARAVLHQSDKLKAAVFLDPQDRKMAVNRSGGPAFPIEQLGCGLDERFTFFDQYVHTRLRR